AASGANVAEFIQQLGASSVVDETLESELVAVASSPVLSLTPLSLRLGSSASVDWLPDHPIEVCVGTPVDATGVVGAVSPGFGLRTWRASAVMGGLDPDADSDSILNSDEGCDSGRDSDGDGTPDHLDTDSDQDCRGDSVEAGDTDTSTAPVDSDSDGRADFVDRDSDGDGLPDGTEDENCDGILDALETSAVLSDTDADAASDLVERALSTDPREAGDSPAAEGILVVLVPEGDAATPTVSRVSFVFPLRELDLTFLVDRSGSFVEERAIAAEAIPRIVAGLTCTPGETGCLEQIWTSVLSIGDEGASLPPFGVESFLDSNPVAAASAINALEDLLPCCGDDVNLTVWSAVGGLGSSSSGCTVSDPYLDAGSCVGSPVGDTGVGYSCRRPEASRIVVLLTDESNIDLCPSVSALGVAASSFGVPIVTAYGSPTSAATIANLRALSIASGALDLEANPLTFEVSSDEFEPGLENALSALTTGVPLTLDARFADDASSDALDASVFVERLETFGDDVECPIIASTDTNADGFPDRYPTVLPGTQVCWNLVATPNTTVIATDAAQVFPSTVELVAEGLTVLSAVDVVFIVPPTDQSAP
ncbi:MAG: hypothetical protein AAF658_10535, partial [Myxococcota bacterium]